MELKEIELMKKLVEKAEKEEKQKEDTKKKDKTMKNLPLPPETDKLTELADKILILKETKNTKFYNPLNASCDGFILFRKNNMKWNWVAVSNFKDIYKIIPKHQAFIIDRFVGTLNNGKPFLMLDEKIPISLNSGISSMITESKKQTIMNENGVEEEVEVEVPIMNGKDLCYDTRSFYTSLDYITLKNLTPKSENNFSLIDFIKDNWIIILIVIALIIVFFFTPFGKEIITQFSQFGKTQPVIRK